LGLLLSRQAALAAHDTVLIHNLEASQSAMRTPPTRLTVDGTVGSVRWQPSNPAVVSWTTDEGKLQLFDTRTRNVTNTWKVAGTKLTGEVYTHAHYDENTIMLGHSNGVVAFFDMRKERRTRFARDLYVPAIGDIVFNTDRSLWSVFGQDQFTMWSKRDALHGAGKVYRGRDSVGAEPQPMASPQICVSTTGSFFGTRLAVTNSLGTIAFYNQPPPYALPAAPQPRASPVRWPQQPEPKISSRPRGPRTRPAKVDGATAYGTHVAWW
jgi:hypothetical protein